MLLGWLMLTPCAGLVGLCGGVSESKADWKENDFQWRAGVVVTSTSGVQPT